MPSAAGRTRPCGVISTSTSIHAERRCSPNLSHYVREGRDGRPRRATVMADQTRDADALGGAFEMKVRRRVAAPSLARLLVAEASPAGDQPYSARRGCPASIPSTGSRLAGDTPTRK